MTAAYLSRLALGARLLVSKELDWSRCQPTRTSRIDGIHLDIVRPMGASRGTVVSLHGMSPIAHRDPRLATFNRAMASLGLTVISPLLPDIAALRIHRDQPQQVADVLQSILRQRTLAPDGRVSIFTVSFTSGPALIAASRPDIAPRVQSICAIGGYADIRSTLTTLMEHPEASRYAALIVMANFFERVYGPAPDVAHALFSAALDDWHLSGDRFVQARKGLSEADRALADALVYDASARRDLWPKVLATRPAFLTAGDVLPHVSGLHASVSLLHGAEDRVIDAYQSVLLARRLRELGVPTRCELTPLLSHGDAQLRPSAMLSLPRLFSLLGGFIADATGEGPPVVVPRPLRSAA